MINWAKATSVATNTQQSTANLEGQCRVEIAKYILMCAKTKNKIEAMNEQPRPGYVELWVRVGTVPDADDASTHKTSTVSS